MTDPTPTEALIERARYRTSEWTNITSAPSDIRLIADLADALARLEEKERRKSWQWRVMGKRTTLYETENDARDAFEKETYPAYLDYGGAGKWVEVNRK